MNPRQGTSGVDWGQAAQVGKSLLLSPLVGFAIAWLLLLICKAIIKDKRLYEAPEGHRAAALLDSGTAFRDVLGRKLLPRF